MRALSIYDRIDAAIGRGEELVEFMKDIDVEYHPQQVRSSVNEFKWTVKRIISLCNEALEEDDCSIDLKMKIIKLLKRYEEIDHKINNIKKTDWS